MTINNPRIFTESFSAASDPQCYDFIYTENGLRNVGSDTWNGAARKVKLMEKNEVVGISTRQFFIMPNADDVSLEIVNLKGPSIEAKCEVIDRKITFICATNAKKGITSTVKDFLEQVKFSAGELIDVVMNEGVLETDKLQLLNETKLSDVRYSQGTEGEIRYDNEFLYLFTGDNWKKVKLI